MTDTPPVAPAAPSFVDALGNWGRALPVLAVLVACYSVEFEITYMIPYGASLLQYYAWQDYVRLGIVWFPVVTVSLSMMVGTLILFAAYIHMRSVNKVLHKQLNSLERQLGETPTPRKGFWRSIITLSEPRWRAVTYLVGLVIMTAAIFLLPHVANVFASFAWVLALMVILHGPNSPAPLSKLVLPDLWGRDIRLAAVLFLAAVVGGLAGYYSDYDAKHPRIAKITAKSEQVAAALNEGCHVIRALSTTLLASCKGKVVAINNSIVEMVEYPPLDGPAAAAVKASVGK